MRIRASDASSRLVSTKVRAVIEQFDYALVCPAIRPEMTVSKPNAGSALCH